MSDITNAHAEPTTSPLSAVDPYSAPQMPEYFVRIACGWISPRRIADRARAIRSASTAPDTQTDYWFQAATPVVLAVPVLDSLVRQFLARFQLPEEVIELSRAFYPDAFDDATVAELRALRFKGEVLDPDLADDVPSGGALIGIRAEVSLMLLLVRPVSVIVEEVTESALRFHSGIQANKVKDFLTFEHYRPEAFATYIELAVARALFGPMLRPHAWRAERVQRMAFPAFNVVSPPPVDAELLERARERARALAKQEFTTLGSPELP